MSDQGKTFTSFVEAELKAERDRRSSLETRGIAVVTTSGTLTTLLAGVGAFVSGRTGFKLPGDAVCPLIGTLIAFALASGLGLAATYNRTYQLANVNTLNSMLGNHWTTHEVDARNIVASINVSTVQSLRSGNNLKADLITGALALQLVGLLLLSYAVYVVLNASQT